MTLRILIGLSLILVAFLAFLEARDPHFTGRLSDLLLNLATELVGIALTVVIIDYLLERRRMKEEVRRIARQALNELDHDVWVWQGGAREFDLAELMTLAANIGADDPLPAFTQNLFLVLGSRAGNTLRTQSDVIRLNSDLRIGLENLSHLASMRDSANTISSADIAVNLLKAIEPLARAAGYNVPPPAPLAPVEFRRTSVREQEWRHYGRER